MKAPISLRCPSALIGARRSVSRVADPAEGLRQPRWGLRLRRTGRARIAIGTFARLGGLFLAVSRRRIRAQGAKELAGYRSDAIHGREEHRLVGFRGLVEAADFAHELKRGRANFIFGHRWFEIEEHLDISAHVRFLDSHRVVRWAVRQRASHGAQAVMIGAPAGKTSRVGQAPGGAAMAPASPHT